MKKTLFILILTVGFGLCGHSHVSNNKDVEYSYNGYYKGNIPHDKLPDAIKKYLKETYPDHYIIVSKRKGNGNYFVKIRYGGNQYRSYYRSLVFGYDGSVIKG